MMAGVVVTTTGEGAATGVAAADAPPGVPERERPHAAKRLAARSANVRAKTLKCLREIMRL